MKRQFVTEVGVYAIAYKSKKSQSLIALAKFYEHTLLSDDEAMPSKTLYQTIKKLYMPSGLYSFFLCSDQSPGCGGCSRPAHLEIVTSCDAVCIDGFAYGIKPRKPLKLHGGCIDLIERDAAGCDHAVPVNG